MTQKKVDIVFPVLDRDVHVELMKRFYGSFEPLVGAMEEFFSMEEAIQADENKRKSIWFEKDLELLGYCVRENSGRILTVFRSFHDDVEKMWKTYCGELYAQSALNDGSPVAEEATLSIARDTFDALEDLMFNDENPFNKPGSGRH